MARDPSGPIFFRTAQRETTPSIEIFEGQRLSFGQKIKTLPIIDWICNIFAVIKKIPEQRWIETLAAQMRKLGSVGVSAQLSIAAEFT